MKNPTSHTLSNLTIFFIIFLGVTYFGFSYGKPSLPSEHDSVKTLMQDLKNYKSLSWKLSNTFDPYNGGSYMRTNSKSSLQLKLASNGTFREISADKIRTGTWMLSGKENALEFICHRVNGRKMRHPYPSTHYTLILYTNETLVLGMQGRHGVVEMKFLPMKQVRRSDVSEHIIF